jgi:pimeloyl-ACP methyl ester carboxylesterase
MESRIKAAGGQFRTGVLAVCLLLIATGCATSSRNIGNANRPSGTLPSEMDIPLLAGLKTTYDRLPWRLTMVPTERDGKVVRVAVFRTGEDNPDSLVILVHGVMASHNTWRYVAADLARDHEVWLVDLPGCGASDKPSPSSLPADGYSPTALADRVLQALAACLRARKPDDFRNVLLVGHSLGGTVVLRAFDDPQLRARHADTLTQISSLALLAPSDVAINAEIPVFRSIVELKGWQVAIGRPLGLVGHATRQATRNGYHVPERATREVALELKLILIQGDTRHATQAMLSQAVPWRRTEHRPDWPGMQQLGGLYDNIDVPCLIVWGEWDETLPDAMGHKLRDEIPGAQLVELAGCGHALPTERPLEIAGLLRDCIAGKVLPVVKVKTLRSSNTAFHPAKAISRTAP